MAGATTTRLAVAALWAIALVAAFATTVPRPWLLTAAGIGLGCMAGYLRMRAIATSTGTRLANALAGLGGIGLLVLAMAFAEDMFLGAWAAGLAGCLLADALVSLPAMRRRAERRPG